MPLTVLCVGATAIWTLVAYFASAPPRPELAESPEEADAVGILRRKTVAGVSMGFGALLLLVGAGLDPGALLDSPAHPGRAWLTAGVAALVLLPIVALSTRSPASRARYPEVRMRTWDKAWVKRSAMTWGVYLAGYELLFRGALVLGAAELIGVVGALGVSTALYVLAHLRKDAGETLSCLAMGPLFGWIALDGGIAPVWALHVAIAVVAEHMAIRQISPAASTAR